MPEPLDTCTRVRDRANVRHATSTPMVQPGGVNRFSSPILSEISPITRASVLLSHGTPDSLASSKNCCLSSISFATYTNMLEQHPAEHVKEQQ